MDYVVVTVVERRCRPIWKRNSRGSNQEEKIGVFLQMERLI